MIDLDLPAWLCMARVIRRVLRSRGKVRADMAPDCPERFDLEFLAYIARFPGTGRRRIEASIANFAGKRVQLRSQVDVRRFLQSLADRA